ncbi:MAG TPA: DNA-processing protein DprA [Bacillota bacterium]|nr:DNA-processing protein DprA [Bacillota bacterium]
MPEPAYWVAFSHLPGIGPRRFDRLLEHLGTAAGAWSAPDSVLLRLFPGAVGERLVAARRELDPEVCWRAVERAGIRVLLRSDPRYPPRLAAIADPPFLLYLHGTLPADDAAVAIVGSRRASPYGLAVAESLGRDLARAGVWVVSGLARGVDTAAHRGALNAGGRTLAVLGSGLERVYPPEARSLARAIAATGGVVSEFSPNTPPLAAHFPVRNRIIAGLSLGVVVVEGAADSGALITAQMAAEEGREVMGVPGPVTSQGSRGPHSLIRDGAALVESARDVLEVLGLHVPDPPAPATEADLKEDHHRLLSELSLEPRLPEALAQRTGLEPGEVLAALLLLETAGRVRRVGAGYIALPTGS